MGDKFIPNSFQTPNLYVDRLAPYLTDPELRVLLYAARRIFGFHKDKDNIALSQFSNGLKGKDGKALDEGTGLTVVRIREALAGLIEYRVMIRVSKNDVTKNAGDVYALQLDDELVDWQGLKDRRESRKEKGRARIQAAREARDTPGSPTTKGQTPGSPTTTPPGLSHNQTPLVVPQLDPPGSPTTNTKHSLNTDRKPEGNTEGAQQRPPSQHYMIVEALSEVTGMDIQKNPMLLREAKHFQPGDEQKIRADYGPGGPWYVNDWRGRKGERPTPKTIRETWGSLKPAKPATFLDALNALG